MTKLHSVRENLVGYSFIAPALFGFIVFMVFPLGYSIFLSFMDWNMFRGLEGSEFIGLENFKAVFGNEYFLTGLKNNVFLAVVAVPILILSSMIIAAILNQNIYGRGALRAAYFMPYVATITAAAVVFSALFHPEFGPVNGILKALGIENPPQWTGSVKWALPTIALFWIWKNIGYAIVIFLAGLQGIPRTYYEAATIDGAGKFKQFWHITFPLVSPTTFFITITSVIGSFQIFPEVQIMTNGGPGKATFTMVFHIYRSAFEQYQMGYASAVAWVFFALVIVVTAIQWIGQKRWVKYV